MTLKSQMASDVANVFLRSDDFAEAATFIPKGVANPGFACLVIFGDITPSISGMPIGVQESRPGQAFGNRAALRAGIGQILGQERDPLHGDQVAVAAGANAGTWKIEHSVSDIGGGVTMELVLLVLYAPGGPNAREVRG